MAVTLTVVGKYNGKDLQRAEDQLARLKKEAQAAASPFTRVGEAFQKSGAKIAEVGGTLTRNVTLPLAGLAFGASKAISAASDLAETQSKVGQVFGSSGKQIEAFASTAATKLGQSKQQAMDAASTFAIFGKSAGLSGNDLVGFSTKFTTLATDLASFNNTSPEEAITAIGAALRGENEPIRKYGVLLDDASMRQEALRLGLVKTTKEALTPQQKVLAAQALIFKQTKDAQGDFARTSGGLANQQRILKAEFANMTAELGKAFLPIALSLAKVFKDQIFPAVKNLIDKFNALSPSMKTGIVLFGAAVAALGPLLVVVGRVTQVVGGMSKAVAFAGQVHKALSGEAVASAAAQKIAAAATKIWTGIQWAFNAAMSANPLVLVGIAIAAVVAAVIIAYKHFDGFRELVDKVGHALKVGFVAAWNAVKTVVGTVVGAVVGFFGRLRDAAKFLVDAYAAYFRFWKELFTTVVGWVVDGVSKILGFFRDLPSKLADLPKRMLEIGKNIVSGIWRGISGAAGWLMDQIRNFAGNIVDGIKGFFGIHSPSKKFAEVGDYLMQGLSVGITDGSKRVIGSMDKVQKTLLSVMGKGKGKKDIASRIGENLRDAMVNAATDALDEIKRHAQDVLDFARDISRSLVSFGGVTGFDTTGDTPTTAPNIIADMKNRVAAVQKFGDNLSKLKGLNLNNASLQEIISAGPTVGNAIAEALLKEGGSAIGQVNDLQSQLTTSAGTIGNFGAQEQFGMSTANADAIVNSTVTFSAGAVVVNVGAGADPTTVAAVQDAVSAAIQEAATGAVETALVDLGKAIKTSKPSAKSGGTSKPLPKPKAVQRINSGRYTGKQIR